MAFFKKVSKKIVADVKETAIEEVKETGKSISQIVAPVLIAFAVGVAVGFLFKRTIPAPVAITIVK